MDIKTLDQALKLQTEFTARLKQNVDVQRTGKLPGTDALLKERDLMLAQAQTDLDVTIKERELAVARWDERVAQRKANLAKLQAEVKEIKSQLGKIKDTGKVGGTVNKKVTRRTKKPD